MRSHSPWKKCDLISTDGFFSQHSSFIEHQWVVDLQNEQ
jgi:hypothetical protein